MVCTHVDFQHDRNGVITNGTVCPNPDNGRGLCSKHMQIKCFVCDGTFNNLKHGWWYYDDVCMPCVRAVAAQENNHFTKTTQRLRAIEQQKRPEKFL